MTDHATTSDRPTGLIIFGGIGAVLLLALIYLLAGNSMFNRLAVTHPECASVYMEGRRDFTPDNFRGEYDYPEIDIDVTPYLMDRYEEVDFPSRLDRIRISGWFVTASEPSDDVVIVVHGGDVCRRNTSVLLPAGMLANNGFNVLLIDLRNHGGSEVVGKRMTLGSTEYDDVLGAFDWLTEQGYEADNIGVMGVSMGAATVTNAFGAEPDIAALWTDSSFVDIETLLDDQLEMNGIPGFFKGSILFSAQLNDVDYTGISPVLSIAQHGGRPVFITHGQDDEWISVNAAPVLHDAAGEQAELWIIEGSRHVEGMFLHPEMYEEKMVAFFRDALN